jgi:hypothetical protein
MFSRIAFHNSVTTDSWYEGKAELNTRPLPARGIPEEIAQTSISGI